MLQPKKTKYQKMMRRRGKYKGNATRGHRLAFGSYGIKVTDRGEITQRQIEAARRAITHHFDRVGKVWIRIFPDKPITQKAAEVPMGSGKGTVEYYAAVVKPGNIIFEVDGVDEALAREAFRRAGAKLPLKTKFVSLNDF